MLTQQQAQSSGTSPPLLRRIEHLIAAAGQTLDDIHSEKAQIVNDQNRIAEQQGLIADASDAVEQARRRIFDRLLVQDDPLIWTINPSSDFHKNLIQELGILLAPEPIALRAYVERRMPTLWVHVIIFGLLLVALCLARRPVRKWTDPSLRHATAIFETPVSSAIVLSILLSASVFAQAPRSLREIFGLVAMIPTTIVLRRLIEPRLFPILSALITLWFVPNLLRAFATPLPILSRWLLLGEILGANRVSFPVVKQRDDFQVELIKRKTTISSCPKAMPSSPDGFRRCFRSGRARLRQSGQSRQQRRSAKCLRGHRPLRRNQDCRWLDPDPNAGSSSCAARDSPQAWPNARPSSIPSPPMGRRSYLAQPNSTVARARRDPL